MSEQAHTGLQAHQLLQGVPHHREGLERRRALPHRQAPAAQPDAALAGHRATATPATCGSTARARGDLSVEVQPGYAIDGMGNDLMICRRGDQEHQPRGVPAAADDLHRAALLRGAHRLHRVQGEPRVQGPPPRARVAARSSCRRPSPTSRARSSSPASTSRRASTASATRATRPTRAPTRSTCASCRAAASPARRCRRTCALRLENAALAGPPRRARVHAARRDRGARRRPGVQHGADAAVREPDRPAQRVRHLPADHRQPRARWRSTSTSTTRRSRRRRSSPSTAARSRSSAACSPRTRTTWRRTEPARVPGEVRRDRDVGGRRREAADRGADEKKDEHEGRRHQGLGGRQGRCRSPSRRWTSRASPGCSSTRSRSSTRSPRTSTSSRSRRPRTLPVAPEAQVPRRHHRRGHRPRARRRLQRVQAAQHHAGPSGRDPAPHGLRLRRLRARDERQRQEGRRSCRASAPTASTAGATGRR